MKYNTLDIHMMKAEAFPYSALINTQIHHQREISWRERLSIRFRALTHVWKSAVLRYQEIEEKHEWVMTLLSTLSVCVLGLFAVGVFWLAVEMDNSDLKASQASSCVLKR